MDKIFSPNKWFVVFCGLLVVTWACLQWVVQQRIVDEAKTVGQKIFSWSWSDKWRSTVRITRAEVVRRSATDAIVKIEGRQALVAVRSDSQERQTPEKLERVDCSALLTFYRMGNRWFLGKVELQ